MPRVALGQVCDVKCRVLVEWTPCGTPDYKSPGFFSVQRWLSPLLSLSVSTQCWTDLTLQIEARRWGGGGQQRGGEGVYLQYTDS